MQSEAARVGVTGWVRNRPDGAVEAEVEGERDAVDAIVAWARHGPSGARVDDVAVAWLEPRGDRGALQIRR
jgi:acylphosphatase